MDILTEAPNLIRRYQEGDAFRLYVRQRLALVIPALFVILTFSIATTAGTVLYVGGTHSWIVLLALVIAPFILLGSLFVQAFVFFSWLEGRAIDRISGHRPEPPQARLPVSLSELRSALGRVPAIPWGVVAIFVLAPFLALALLSIKLASALFVAALLTPILYSVLDR